MPPGPTRPLAWVLLAGLLLAAPPAAAHANLVSADPAPNGRVDEAPGALALRFSEPLEETYTGVEVVDGNGTDHVTSTTIVGDARTELSVALEPLDDGLYTVRWKTLSAADGHTRSGVYLLAVNASLAGPGGGAGGNGTQPGSNATGEMDHEAGPGDAEAAVRGLAFLGAAPAVGLPLVLLALPPLAAAAFPERRLTALAAAGGGLAAAASLGLVAFLAARIGTDLGAALGTTHGTRLAWRAGLHALGGVLLAGASLAEDDARRGALLGAGALAGTGAFVATSLAGHAAGLKAWRSLALVSDGVHQVAVAFWIAGVVTLATGTATNRARPADLAAGIRRLSPLFVAAVVLVVATGSLASWLHLAAVDDLWSTPYGWALSAKILLLLPIVGLGAYHRYRILPALQDREGPGVRRRLRRSAALEVGLMILVLAAAGALTNVSPPSATPDPGSAPGFDGNGTGREPGDGDDLEGVLRTTEEDGFRLEFAVRPQPVTVGAQNVTTRVTPLEGDLPANADVVLNLNPPSDPHGEGETVDLTRWRNDTWSREGPVFVESGEWRILLALQGKDTYVQDPFRLDVR